MKLLRDERYHLPLLIFICAVLFFWKISVIPLTDGDSAFYAKIAKNIVETGDWLTMHYGDPGTIIDKPPLFMWLTAASFKLFGVNDMAVTFWHSLFALLIVVFTYKLAKEIFDPDTAFLSSLILATSAQFFYQARSPLQDIPLTLFILLSVYFYLLYEKYGNIPCLYLCPIFVSLAVLTKGPVGLALPGIILLAYILINRKKFPPLLHIACASILFLALTVPWFVAEYRILGQRFIDLFVGHNLGRYLRPVDTIGGEAQKYNAITPQYDFYSYFLQLLILMVPWSGFIYPALYNSLRKKKDNIPVIIALSVILFFSLSLNYKISRYILPAFPALAIMIGNMISSAEEDVSSSRSYAFSSWFTLIAIIFPVLIASAMIVYRSFSDVGHYYLPMFLPFLIMMVLTLFICSILGIFGAYKKSFVLFVVLSFMSYLMLINHASYYFVKINPIRAFTRSINSIATPTDTVCQYKGTDAHFMIYYSKYSVRLVRNEDSMKELLLSKGKVYCITENASAFDELKAQLGNRIQIIDKSANFRLFSN